MNFQASPLHLLLVVFSQLSQLPSSSFCCIISFLSSYPVLSCSAEETELCDITSIAPIPIDTTHSLHTHTHTQTHTHTHTRSHPFIDPPFELCFSPYNLGEHLGQPRPDNSHCLSVSRSSVIQNHPQSIKLQKHTQNHSPASTSANATNTCNSATSSARRDRLAHNGGAAATSPDRCPRSNRPETPYRPSPKPF